MTVDRVRERGFGLAGAFASVWTCFSEAVSSAEDIRKMELSSRKWFVFCGNSLGQGGPLDPGCLQGARRELSARPWDRAFHDTLASAGVDAGMQRSEMTIECTEGEREVAGMICRHLFSWGIEPEEHEIFAAAAKHATGGNIMISKDLTAGLVIWHSRSGDLRGRAT